MKTSSHVNDRSLDYIWRSCLCTLFAAVVIMIPDFAMAANSPMGDVMCAAADMIWGKPGMAVGTIAIAALGMAATLGKVTWGMCLICCAGLGAMFGAPTLIFDLNTGTGGSAIIERCT